MSRRADVWSWIVLVVLALFVLSVFIRSCNYRKLKDAKTHVMHYNGQKPTADPWGNMYRVTKTEEEGKLTVMITSAGPDESFGTDDDIHGGYRRSTIVEVK